MRAFLIFAVVVGLGGLYFWQKQSPATTISSAATNSPARPEAVAVLTPAPRGQASEYNWMKRSLDRAATVRDQARGQTQAAQNP